MGKCAGHIGGVKKIAPLQSVGAIDRLARRQTLEDVAEKPALRLARPVDEEGPRPDQ